MDRDLNGFKERCTYAIKYNKWLKDLYKTEMRTGIEPTFDNVDDEKTYRSMRNIWRRNDNRFRNIKIMALIFPMILIGIGIHGLLIYVLQVKYIFYLYLLITSLLTVYIIVKQDNFKYNPTYFFIITSTLTVSGLIAVYTNYQYRSILIIVFMLMFIVIYIYSIIMYIKYSERKKEDIKIIEDVYDDRLYSHTMLYATFLGSFGVHHFINNKKTTGIIIILLNFITFGIVPLIWSAVDLVLLISGHFKNGDGQYIYSEKSKYTFVSTYVGVLGIIVKFITTFIIFMLVFMVSVQWIDQELKDNGYYDVSEDVIDKYYSVDDDLSEYYII